MANFVYPLALEQFGLGTLAWDGTLKVALVSAAYTPNPATDQFLSTVAAAIIARSSALGSPAVAAGGVASASNVSFTNVTGAVVLYLVVYKDTGSDATSPLIVCIDTAQGLPCTPVGTSIGITWDPGQYKIFKL